MAFTTKLDFSNNRQVKQRLETIQNLSGATSFGTTFSSLPTGPNTTTSAITSTFYIIPSTFSGNSGTTNYSWYDSRMSLGNVGLSAITPSNSATTQNTGPWFSASTFTTIDGNTVATSYTGVSFNITVTGMTDLGGGNYSGSLATNTLNILSAGTLDFTGRTIWNDVSGITRTQRLIITNNPQIGYVLTCATSEGMSTWSPSSSGTSTNIWIPSTGNHSAIISGSSNIASGNYSIAEGNFTTASGDISHAEGYFTVSSSYGSHAEGYSTTASGSYSHVEGQNTKAIGSSSHAEGGGTTAIGDSSHAEGFLTTASGQYSHAEGNGSTAIGFGSHAEGVQTLASGYGNHSEGANTIASGTSSHAEGSNTLANGFASHAEGDTTIASGNYSHAGGRNSHASGITSFIHSTNSVVIGDRSVVIGGQNLTGSTNDYVYVPSLNINVVGSSAFVNDVRIDGNGNLTTNTSDFRLKENINTLTNALEKINKLRGVTYEWKDKIAGGKSLRIGFIAQEVEDVDPLLVFTNKHDGFMGLHIDCIIPLLVEAVKELSNGITTSNNTHLETQTILAEDNNIELNYSGNQQTAIGGGIRVLHAKGENLGAELITDKNGDWTTNNDFKSKALTIPLFTPSSTNDINGNDGNITRDDDYLYVKTNNKWKRINLTEF